MMAARNLSAELNNIEQDGIAAMDSTGYFNPDREGATYDKLRYNSELVYGDDIEFR